MDTADINKNFGMVITRDVSVAIKGTNFVIEKATQPATSVANNILTVAFQYALSSSSRLERFCSIYNSIIISIIAPTD